jgi:hypothetical protein
MDTFKQTRDAFSQYSLHDDAAPFDGAESRDRNELGELAATIEVIVRSHREGRG